jgi:CheY-like chemotaxis protein
MLQQIFRQAGGIEQPGELIALGTVVSFPRTSGVPDKRQGADRRNRPRGGRRIGDQQGFAPLVLLVDEDADNGQRCEAILVKLRFAVAPAHTLAEATRAMDALRPNLIVGHVSDPEALKRAAPPDIPLVILDDSLSAPDAMIGEIRRALRKRATEKE